MTRPRSRLWWFMRFVRAYRKHGVYDSHYGIRKTWDDAMYARRVMPAKDQRLLGPLGSKR
jgi:hypothetical protein